MLVALVTGAIAVAAAVAAAVLVAVSVLTIEFVPAGSVVDSFEIFLLERAAFFCPRSLLALASKSSNPSKSDDEDEDEEESERAIGTSRGSG